MGKSAYYASIPIFILGLVNLLNTVAFIVLASVYRSDEFKVRMGGFLSFFLLEFNVYTYRWLYPLCNFWNAAAFAVMNFIGGVTMIAIATKMWQQQQDPMKSKGIFYYGAVLIIGIAATSSTTGLNQLEYVIPTFIALVAGWFTVRILILDGENNSSLQVEERILIPWLLFVVLALPEVVIMQMYGTLTVTESGMALPRGWSALIIGQFILYFIFLFTMVLPAFHLKTSSSALAVTIAVFITLWNFYIPWIYFSTELYLHLQDTFTGLDNIVL